MLYRIYTENKNREQVEAIVARRFSGFTISAATGYWQGQREDSLVIEVIPPESLRYPELAGNNIQGIAEDIQALNQQESVLIQQVECESWLV